MPGLAKRIYSASIENEHDPMKDGMIVPLIDNFMIASGRDVQRMDKDAIEIVVSLIKMGNDRLDNRQRRTSFSGGSCGACLREQVINIRQKEESPLALDYKAISIFEDGNWRNIRWITMFQRAGLLLRYETPYHTDEFNYSLTPDAELDLSEYYGKKFKRVPVEIKGMHSGEYAEFVKGTARSKWARARIMQVHAYMIALDLPWWIIWAENKNDQSYFERIIPRDPGVEKYIRSRYAYMIKAVKNKALPAIECEMENTDTKFARCRRKTECVKLRNNEARVLPPLKNRVRNEAMIRKVFR